MNPYLHFDGQCEAAFQFYEQCLGGKIEAMMPFAGSPAEKQAPPGWGKKILHARLKLGDHVMMGSDAMPDHYHKPSGFSLSLGIQGTAEAE
ncbi:MAG TPA: VOC family protein, partial [Acidobacteriaceae bacterium]|nr:VOC family protein [Acidobacteriaceae bacterium]